VIESWPVPRRLMSLIATWIAQRALRVRCADPLSGFFLFRRQFLEAARITGVGNKPLLEVLVTSRPVVNEIPYVFRNRRNGESKLGARNIVEFLGLVLRLRSWSNGHAPARRQSSRSWDLNPPQH
jgi:dolichol-phosphate mannosyltransferase